MHTVSRHTMPSADLKLKYSCIQGTWVTEYGFDMYFTTEAHIIPDTFPAEACTSPEECWSKLV